MVQQQSAAIGDGIKTGGRTKKGKVRLILAAGTGNFLEMFDFTVFSFFLPIIAEVFFKSEDKWTGILFTTVVFGIGFIARPLGSVVIGAYADRHGRKGAMLLTIVLMALGSILICFAPTPASVGLFAPVILVIGRLLQGFSAGGEIGAATTLLMESADKSNRGFFVSWQFCGQAVSFLCGSLIAAGLKNYLPVEALHSWGWRVPFGLALLIIPVGLYIRAHIEETYEKPEATDEEMVHPFKVLVTEHLKQAIFGMLFIFPATVLTYVLIFYIPTYLGKVTDIGGTKVFLVASYGSCILIAMSVVCAFLYDRLPRRKPFILYVFVVLFVATYCVFHFVTNLPVLLVAFTIAMIGLGFVASFSTLMIMESFEQKIRATATAVIYGFSVSIFGGTAQIIVTWFLKISDGNIMSPFWYVGPALVIGFIATCMLTERRYDV